MLRFERSWQEQWLAREGEFSENYDLKFGVYESRVRRARRLRAAWCQLPSVKYGSTAGGGGGAKPKHNPLKSPLKASTSLRSGTPYADPTPTLVNSTGTEFLDETLGFDSDDSLDSLCTQDSYDHLENWDRTMAREAALEAQGLDAAGVVPDRFEDQTAASVETSGSPAAAAASVGLALKNTVKVPRSAMQLQFEMHYGTGGAKNTDGDATGIGLGTVASLGERARLMYRNANEGGRRDRALATYRRKRDRFRWKVMTGRYGNSRELGAPMGLLTCPEARLADVDVEVKEDPEDKRSDDPPTVEQVAAKRERNLLRQRNRKHRAHLYSLLTDCDLGVPLELRGKEMARTLYPTFATTLTTNDLGPPRRS